ncbi:hypothetical protein B0J12DRAFT_785550, partial [Macrophomina phaseolina]
MLGMAIRDRHTFFASALAALVLGAWIECQEWTAPFRSDDDSISAGCTLGRWVSGEVAAKANVSIGTPRNFPEAIREGGFLGVTVVEAKWLLRPWPNGKMEKRIGQLFFFFFFLC